MENDGAPGRDGGPPRQVNWARSWSNHGSDVAMDNRTSEKDRPSEKLLVPEFDGEGNSERESWALMPGPTTGAGMVAVHQAAGTAAWPSIVHRPQGQGLGMRRGSGHGSSAPTRAPTTSCSGSGPGSWRWRCQRFKRCRRKQEQSIRD